MRKPTDPGLPAPPAPGSVGPMFGPPPNAFPEEEIPTKREAVDPETLKLVRLLDCMPPVERRRFLSMTEHYGKMPLGRRVLFEELARELAGKGT